VEQSNSDSWPSGVRTPLCTHLCSPEHPVADYCPWLWQVLAAERERFEVISSAQVRWQLGGNPWQHYPQVLTSLDVAKRDDVAPDLLRAEWDLVIIDEAHKCAAYTYGDEVKKTRRYVLAEELARRTERLLLLTATPHSGDPDGFVRFLALLDPDQSSSAELVRHQLAAPNSPYFLRRQKEHLVDEHGGPLFVKRKVLTQPFTLSPGEFRLYRAVTDYISEFLGVPPPGCYRQVLMSK
jgi:SNF2 family DNA or RNA helicase